MNVLALIPARGGSKGLRNKNILDLAGKPMIQYTIDSAKKAKMVNNVVVSTEDPEITEVSERAEAYVIARPPEYSRDDSPIYPALRHAVRYLGDNESYHPEIVVWLQPNVPMREDTLIDDVVKKLIQNYESIDSVVTVFEVDQHPETMKIIKDGILSWREKPRKVMYIRQELEKNYLLDGSVMAIKTKKLMEEGHEDTDAHFYMGRMIPYIHSFPYTLEIHSKEDLLLIECIIEKLNIINHEKGVNNNTLY